MNRLLKQEDFKERAIRFLRPQSKIDLILNLDLLQDVIEVRSSVIYELDPQRLIMAQTDPPILKSMIGREIEATFLAPGLENEKKLCRWGYSAALMDLIPDYRLHRDDQLDQQALVIGAPTPRTLYESNVRLAFRVPVADKDGLSLKFRSHSGLVSILDLSVGGVLASLPGAPHISIGDHLWHTLIFPDQAFISGEAEVRRVYAFGRPVKNTLIGLKFLRLDVDASRTLGRWVNRLMLQAQRLRYERLGEGR
ncbi:MAG: PilZ domain-containing protein [Thermodesulfobacteriota bacterium]